MSVLKPLRLALVATVLLASASSASFGQTTIVPPSDVDPAVKNAVSFMIFCNGDYCNPLSGYVVPKGHRLVITTVSGRVSNTAAAYFQLGFTLRGEAQTHIFPMNVQAVEGDGGSVKVVQTHHVSVVADSLVMEASELSEGNGNIFVSGYLVKM